MSNEVKKAVYKLKNLLVKELSLVDRGANQEANITLFKRENKTDATINFDPDSIEKGKEQQMDFQELINKVGEIIDEKVTPVVEKVEALEKKVSASETATEKVEKTEVVEKSEVEKVSELLTKKLDDVQKELQETKKELEVQKELKKQKELEKRAEKELAYVPGTLEEKVEMLKLLDGNEAGMKLLKAANASGKKVLGELGHSNPVQKSAEDQLESLAKALSEKESISFEDAYAKVMDTPEGQKLYEQLV